MWIYCPVLDLTFMAHLQMNFHATVPCFAAGANSYPLRYSFVGFVYHKQLLLL